MNLGTGRIVVIVALLVVGAAVLANGFADGGVALGSGPDGSVSVSESPSASASSSSSSPTASPTPAPQVDGVLFQVFNGTYTTGLGATAQEYLESKGYTKNAVALDAPSKPIAKTVVYFRGGDAAAQNESDAAHMAEKYFGGAKVQELSPEFDDLVKKTTQVVVVVGDDYATTLE